MDALLDIVRKGGVLSTAELAYRTGTSAEMVEARLEQYARLGYLRKTAISSGGCGCGGACGSCKGCPAAGGSAAPKNIAFWEAGEKLK